MNEVEIAFEEGGLEGILPYREQIFGIASQCPFQGGQGVFRARYFFSFFNDSIEYNDAAVCLAQGILKTKRLVNGIIPHMLIKPNPASSQTEIKMKGFGDEQFSLTITDIHGRELFVKNNLSFNETVYLQTKYFTQGVYYVIARKNKSHLCREKLIIIR
ncbi:MAG: T9SS type A sorting domain-containing protein [Bacteroidetes bacterium]|nr:T9SS type A sorting domain-containing protein [Bacteroidota bacterium]